MIRRILYPTDFSDHAKRCIDYILHLRDCGIEEVVLLHVMNEQVMRYAQEISGEFLDEQQLFQHCQQKVAAKMAELEEPLTSAGISTRTMTRLGIPFSEIIRVAEEIDASLVVLGHRGHNLAAELLLGSTAEKVARKCQRPVLLIR